MEVSITVLSEFSNACLEKVGVPQDEAAIITQTMIEADTRGINSHGLMRLPIYIERIQKGFIRNAAEITIEKDTIVTANLDGHYSAGQIVATKAIDIAIQKAEAYGVGIVSVKNSNHFGIAAHYALKAAKQDMIGIVMSNTAPLMPPIGGAEKVIGNNPLAIAVPTHSKYPILLDMALSHVALGKILYAQSQGDAIPEGWGVDKDGLSTTSPSEVLDGGFILPAAGPKGFGLAVMVELLTGVLSGGEFSKMIHSMYDVNRRQSISHFMLVINIAALMDIEQFKNRAFQLSEYIKNAVRAKGVNEIYLPGEIEFLSEEKRIAEGIPVSAGLLEQLNKLGDQLQIELFN